MRARVACLVMLLLSAPASAGAGIALKAVSVDVSAARTRIVFESGAALRFSLFFLRNPDRVILELEGALPGPELDGLARRLQAEHPYMKPMRVKPGARSVQLEFPVKGEVEPAISALAPGAGHGYRLVLDIVPQGAVPAAQPAPPAPALTPPLPNDEEANLALLEVRVDDYVLSEAITTYQYGRETFLPLGELARLLTLAIRTQAEQGTADGFVLKEERSFSMNVAQGRLTLADRTQLFDPALVRVRKDDIYVASSQLARWLPLDFDIDRSSLTLNVRPRERLPLQERLQREHQGEKTGARSSGYLDPGFARHEIPYGLLGVPFIDQTLGLGLRTGDGSRQTTASYTAYLTGDLLGMEAAMFVRSTKHEPAPDARFTLGRHDPEARLLGPLHARSVVFGSGVVVPSVPNIASNSLTAKGFGMTLSNRPLNQPTSFDRHTLQGDLPPGWDVELYFNEALVGFQSSRADGRYRFDDQPLAYGLNEFRLVFHGPLGQQRVERQSFLLDQASTPPGAFYYNLAQYRDRTGQSRAVAQFEWGLNKYLTATGGFSHLPALAGGESTERPLYSNLGIRSFLQSFILSSDFFRSSSGGWLNESALKTRVGSMSFSYNRLQLHDFSSEAFLPGPDPLRIRNKLRIDGALPVPVVRRLPITFELQRDQLQSGRTNLALSGRVAAYIKRVALANQLTWQTSGGTTRASGALQISSRFASTGVSGQLGYTIKPGVKLDTITLSGDQRLGENYLLNVGLLRSLESGETLATAGLNKSLGSFGLGLSSSYSSSGVFAVGLQLFIAMGREPRHRQWRVDALPKADIGTASVRVFVDGNANGIMDPGEEPIQNVAMTVNGNRAPARTDASGIAWMDRLPVRQAVDIAVDVQTLEDPSWVPQRKGVRLVPRRGRAAELDFPVSLTGEIDGTVYFVEKTQPRGIGNVVIELLDRTGKLVSSISSSSDGYYIVPAVVPGHYNLRVSPQQLKQLGLIDPGVREVTILPNAEYVNGMDFLLSKNLMGTASAVPGTEAHEKK